MDTNISSMAFFKNMKCNKTSTSSSTSRSRFFGSKASRASQIGPLNPALEKIMSSNNSSPPVVMATKTLAGVKLSTAEIDTHIHF
ncbi:hypothetical protein BGZ81_010684 [Podila clonocystis]|nr:hypothetical protein BGZ81_010684 [Podila clonocystis]